MQWQFLHIDTVAPVGGSVFDESDRARATTWKLLQEGHKACDVPLVTISFFEIFQRCGCEPKERLKEIGIRDACSTMDVYCQ